MFRGLVVVAACALLVPAGPAVAKAPPPGRTVVLTVKGVPTGAKAKIVLKGPKKTHKTLKTHGNRTVRHLKPGRYRVLPKKVTTTDGTWKATARPKTVKVTKRKGARVRIVYSAPTTPPVDETPDLPATPFPQTLAPQSLTLLSKTAAGAPGDKWSLSPAWSPEGTTVAFASCAGNLAATPATSCHLYTGRLSDGAVARIPNTSMTDIFDWGGEPDWSPDGSHLAFTTMSKLVAGDTDSNKDVYVITPAGTGAQRVSQTQAGTGMQGDYPGAHDPQWSPDGTRVMFLARATNLATGVGNVYIKTLIGGAVTNTGAGERTEGARWSKDGRIAFTAGTEVFNPATYGWDRSFDVYVALGNGAAVSAATSDHGVWGPPTWSPAGVIAYATSAPLVPSDTNEANDVYTTTGQRLSTGPAGEQSLWSANGPVWSPDGQKVAFVATGQGPSTILVKNLATGSVTQLVDPTNGVGCSEYETDEESGERYCAQTVYYDAVDPVWSPDSAQLAFSCSYPDLVPGDTNGTWDVFIATL